MRHFIRGSLASLWKDCRGSLFAYTAIAAPVLVGLAGLSVDIGVWYTQARLAQSAADSAALAGALEIIRSKSNTADVKAAARTDAKFNGFSTANGDTVTVEYPPSSGLMVGSMDSVEVIVTRQSPSLLSSVVYDDGATVVARAVARGDVNDTCVWSLNPTKQATVSVTGGAQVSLGCGIIANSSDDSALLESGSGCLNATKVKVVGGADGDCINPSPLTNVPPIEDPLASIQPPPEPYNCDYNNKVISNGNRTLDPGVYCGQIKITTNGTVTFNPGLYILDGAGLEIGAQATVVGSGLTFYLSSNSTPGQPKEINIAAGATVQLSASASEYPGILFYHDRNSPSGVTHNFTGGGDMDLVGILYFPNQHVNVSGGSSVDAIEAIFVADTISFTGNTTIGGFTNAPIPPNPLLINAVLVE